MEAVVFVPLGLFWLICAFASGAIAKSKGRDYASYFLLGLILGLIGLIIAAAISPTPSAPSAQPLVWVPTHEVPAGGVKAWGQPNPSGESIQVPGGTRLRLDQTLGDWGKVTNANGVSGWVNAQRLVSLNAPPTTRCPFCAELIQPQAIVCRWCGRDLPGRGLAEPLPPPAPAAEGSVPAAELAQLAPSEVHRRVSEPGADLRSQPRGEVIAHLTPGTRVQELGREGGFVKVAVPNGVTGWVPKATVF